MHICCCFFLSNTLYIKRKLICFLKGGDYHIVGFLEVYRKFISLAVVLSRSSRELDEQNRVVSSANVLIFAFFGHVIYMYQ